MVRRCRATALPPQGAQKGQVSHPPNPASPRRAIPHARPRRVKTGGGTDRTSWGRSPVQGILANGKTPSVFPTSENLNRYVEDLNDARTKLADCFSILLHTRLPIMQRQVELNQSIWPHSVLAQHRIVEDGVVLQCDGQYLHIFDGHRQPCHVYNHAPRIQA